MDLKLGHCNKDGIEVADVEDEIEISTAPRLRELLIDLAGKNSYQPVIYLDKVGFPGSTGLGVLVGGLKRVRAHDGSLDLLLLRSRPGCQTSAGSTHSADSPATIIRGAGIGWSPACQCTFASRGLARYPPSRPAPARAEIIPWTRLPFPGVGAALRIFCMCPVLMSWQTTASMTGAANRSHSLRWVCACLRDHCPWTGRRSGETGSTRSGPRRGASCGACRLPAAR